VTRDDDMARKRGGRGRQATAAGAAAIECGGMIQVVRVAYNHGLRRRRVR